MSCGPDCRTGCECCRGTTELTPASVENRPGLSALAYRVGVHGSFEATMRAGLSGQPALRGLTTREDRDPTIALLDAWATTLDVLTFYQERIANEGFLRTATERRSIVELARSLGYETNPGVAASTFLAFTLDGSPGSPPEVVIPAGTRVQSLPQKRELPQTFETDEELVARPEWSVLSPKARGPQTVTEETEEIVFQGAGLALRPGDALLLRPPATGSTAVPAAPASASVVGQAVPAVTRSAPSLRRVRKAEPGTDTTRVTLDKAVGAFASLPKLFVLRQPASLFGHNAPDSRAMPDAIRARYVDTSLEDWKGFGIRTAALKQIDLDAVYPQLTAGGLAVLVKDGSPHVFTITQAETVSRADFTLAAKVTRLTLDRDLDADAFPLRETSVLAGSEELILAEVPLGEDVAGDAIALEAPGATLERGRRILVRGIDGQATEPSAEIAVIETSGASLTLKGPLRGSYQRETVTILANVAPASHGETQREVLGSGDGARGFQRFRLRQKPLTYRAAEVPSGGESTVEVRVDGVRWHESPDLLRLGPGDRAFTLRHDAEGETTVGFGDRTHGARLPSGVENVAAVYRKGIGREGNVAADRLSLLLNRPLGVKTVTNPAPADGAADPESLDDARRNAPRTVLILDRVVSLTDYENFARSFAGVGKAQARLLWVAGERRVHLTVAAVDGTAIAVGSALFRSLREALERHRNRGSALTVASVVVVPFFTALNVNVHPDHRREDVFPRVETELRRRFSPAARDFGQGVSVSELAAVVQGVAGVVAGYVDRLYLGTPLATTPTFSSFDLVRRVVGGRVVLSRLEPRLFAQPARLGPQGDALPAQILALAPESPTLSPMP